MGKQIAIKCQVCGKEVKTYRHEQKYCSTYCANTCPERRAKVSKGRKKMLATPDGRKMYEAAMEKRNKLPYYQRREHKRTRERDIAYSRTEYRTWRNAVIRRDDYTCQKCGKRGGILQAHHIKEWATHPELRYEISNGITYCPKCHSDEHGYWIHADKKCPVCHKRFTPHQIAQVCCSNKCSGKQRSDKARKLWKTYTCAHCKKTFKRNVSRKYCSRKCYWASMRGAKRNSA